MSQQSRVGKTATSVFTDESGTLCCIYHSTCVAKRHSDGTIELNSGGWRTATTKTRMNQFAQQYCNGAFHVSQHKHQWYVSANGSLKKPFRDHIRFHV